MVHKDSDYILADDTKRIMGKTAQRNNILAAKLVAETVRSTLGPKGMDKMLVDYMGNIIVTNDGVTILEEMQIEHPAAKMVVEVAKTQEKEIGDGTTTAVILAGELLKNAEKLLDKEIHPTIISRGYRLARAESIKVLKDTAETISISDDKFLRSIAITAMTGKGAEIAREHLADLVVKSVKQVLEETKEGFVIDKENIKIQKMTGASIEDSELVQGIILDKEKVHPAMPRLIENAKIALIDSPLEIKNMETEAKIQITDPTSMQEFLDMEEKMLKKMSDKIIESGANVVICQKGIDDVIQHFLSKQKIYAVRRVTRSDIEKISRATGATIINNLNELMSKDLGVSEVVEEKRVGNDNLTYITGFERAKAVTILIRGGTEHIIDEAERAVMDAVGDVSATLKDKKAVGGAGACEILLSNVIKQYATKLSGRERLAVEAFAESIEVVPETLAENAGFDPIDCLTELKSTHNKGMKWAGLDAFSGKVLDSWKEGIVEPLRIKIQAIQSASEVAEMILRIDDILAAGKQERSNQQNVEEM